jgi:hypothetical protein
MPDTRKHRGPQQADERELGNEVLAALREATLDFSWLLGRAYSSDAALKLVGDKYQLTARQRAAVLRAAASDAACARRCHTRLEAAELRDAVIGIDGFNCLITIECALAGAPVVLTRDRTHRDLASVHGTYRTVEETAPALSHLTTVLRLVGVAEAHFYLDRPIGSSGRLRALIEETLADAPFAVTAQVCDDVDHKLISDERVIASSDSYILDRATSWVDLPGMVIACCQLAPFLIDLS